MRVRRVCLAFVMLLAISSAAAQPAPEGEAAPLPPAPPPPPAAEVTPPGSPAAPATAPAAPAVEAACEPACRTGYFCYQGQCISGCNPPCQPGEQCAENGECVMDPAAASASRVPPSGAPPSIFPPGPPPAMPPPKPGKERHDGFMLRLTLGFGSDSLNAKSGARPFNLFGASGRKLELSGFALHFSFDIGAAPIDNFIIHARLAFAATGDTNPRVDGVTLDRTANAADAVVDLFGPALTYYFMPLDIYVTAAAGWSSISLYDVDKSTDTGSGLGLNFDLGKEFWVADDWGLGGALRFWYTHLSDSGVSYDFLGWAIVFSATYQ